MPFGSDDLVDDIMRRAPHTIRVFLAFRMACVGCPIATFHTVDDACRAVARLGEIDLASQDVLIDVVRELEEQQWMLRVQLTGRS